MQKNWKHRLSSSLTIWLITSIVFIGVFTSQVWIARAELTPGNALSFNGTSDYVEVPNSASLTPSEITIEAWIRPLNWTHTPTAVVIVAKRAANTEGYMFFWLASTKTITVDFGGSTPRWNTGYNPPLNTWIHLAYTFSNANKGRFYVNGNLYNTTTLGAFVASTSPLRVGMDTVTAKYWFKGSIDEVRVYNRACTGAEIGRHYSLGIGEYGRPETGLNGLWHFDGDANDYSGLANNGTVYGAVYVTGHVPLPDVAILSVSSQTTQVLRGDTVAINVTAENVGAGAYEDFTVTLYGNDTVIEAKPVTGLLPNSNTTLTFTWDTTGYPLGTYTIRAEASTVQGETNTGNNVVVDGTVLVFLASPETAFTHLPQTPVVDEAVTFDASTSTPGAGTIASYTWNFSDGTSIVTTDQPTTLHTFTQHGTYNVTLTVVNTYEMSDTAWALVTVLAYPKARFTYLPTAPLEDEAVTFDASTSTPGAGAIASYTWNFGDGTSIVTTDQPTTVHTFTQRGTYNVTLTVVDTQPLSDTAWALVTVTIHDLAALDLIVSKTVIGQGFPLDIVIKIRNIGDYIENPSITAYANSHIIYTTTITIPSGSLKIINFTLDTATLAKGTYMLSFIVWPVQFETDTTNNMFTGNPLTIAMQGDVSGPTVGTPDGKVDTRDLAYIAILYGVISPDPRYICNCDLTGPTKGIPDGKIDIRDLIVPAVNLGRIDP